MFHLVRAVAGSKLYGTNTHASDDDFVGIFMADSQEKLGLSCREQVVESKDITIYELSKYVRLAAGGNPTILQLLYTPESHWVQWTEEWPEIQSTIRSLCVSQLCRPAFLGYLQQQKRKMIDNRQQRPELVARFGYDTKFAMHALRLGSMGLMLLRTGSLQFPLYNKDYLINVRTGLFSQAYCLEMVETLENELKAVHSSLPLAPDYDRINQWLAETYMKMWGK